MNSSETAQWRTAGPWNITYPYQDEDGDFGLMVQGGPDKEQVAVAIGTWPLEEPPVMENDPRCVANARLIAAAPDLLAVLKQVQKRLGITNTFCPLGAALDLAKPLQRAIMKAEGGAA